MHETCNGVNTVIMVAQYKERDFSVKPLVIGTRGSPLAVSQAEETRDRLMKAHSMPASSFRIEIITTTGDKIQDRPLSEIGGKGLFTEEIENLLIDGSIDIAVHSMKDMPTQLPKGLGITSILPREDVRDSFVSSKYKSIKELPLGATVGTSSLRRRAQLLAIRPDLKVIEFRGNVQTRLKKLDQGIADATFLACAGLSRLNLRNLINPIPISEMLPAVSQGAIGIEQNEKNDLIREIVALITDKDSEIQLEVERAFLLELDGSCRTPIGGYAEILGEEITFHGEILKPDGSETYKGIWKGELSHATELGKDAAKVLKEKGGTGFFE